MGGDEWLTVKGPPLDLDRYRTIVGDGAVEGIYEEASELAGKRVAHVNSTYMGGGVAELLESLVPLMNAVGIKTEWDVFHGTPDFFTITKKFNNALQGMPINLTEMKKRIFETQNQRNSLYHEMHHDFVIVHDPQPLPLITFYEKAQPWIWRCHVDMSSPVWDVWEYLRGFVTRYDAAVFSSKKFLHDLAIPLFVIPPSIDPLSPKNKALSERTISKYLSKFGIPRDKPLLTQVSRFDHWKDPLGVLKVFRKVRKEVDCRLVLIGSFALDDPEGQRICEALVRKTGGDEDISLIATENHILVNALQRASTVVLQKSIREGFGLTVTEALWKGTPVVASRVGGIPEQIADGVNGFLVEPHDYGGWRDRIMKLLEDQKLREEMGIRGREVVRERFLVTRHLLDYINLLKSFAG